MSFKTSLLGVMTVGAMLSACQHSDSQSPLHGTEQPRRVHASYVSFTKWTDTMQIDTAVTTVNGACQIMEPLVSDASTNWRPFQIYWAIRDSADDVQMSTINDAYFAGDVANFTEFTGAIGLAHLNTQFAGMLELKAMVVSADRSSVQATIGSPFNAVLQIQTALEGDVCATHASYCPSSGDCSTPAAFTPLSYVHVKQNWLGYPSEVIFN